MNKRDLARLLERYRDRELTPEEEDLRQKLLATDEEAAAWWKHAEEMDEQIAQAITTCLETLPMPPMDSYRWPFRRQVIYAFQSWTLGSLRFAGMAAVMIILAAFIIVPLIIVIGTARTGHSTGSIPTTPSVGSKQFVTPTPTVSPSAIPQPTPKAPFAMVNPPAVPNAAAAKQYSGQEITYYGDAVGLGPEIDLALSEHFEQETGIRVNVYPRSRSETESYPNYQRFFREKSSSVDVFLLDTIRIPAFAPHLVDLTSKLGPAAQQHDANTIQNWTCSHDS